MAGYHQNRALQAALYWDRVAKSSLQTSTKSAQSYPSSTSSASAVPSFAGVSVITRDIDQILANWDALLRDFPSMKRELLDRIGKDLLARVQREIPGTGKVRSWQERYIGSRNGYVAIRPRAKTYKITSGGKKYAVGYVTNAIEGGHKHRKPSQTPRDGYKYRARINVPAVPGLHFYASVRSQLYGLGEEQLRALVKEVAARLEGGT